MYADEFRRVQGPYEDECLDMWPVIDIDMSIDMGINMGIDMGIDMGNVYRHWCSMLASSIDIGNVYRHGCRMLAWSNALGLARRKHGGDSA